MKTYNLLPSDSHKSFYGKAKVSIEFQFHYGTIKGKNCVT